jgi:hypothetical protein
VGIRQGNSWAWLALVLAGVVLRLIWPADMEWKGDEIRMHAAAVGLARGDPLPWTGMQSGVGIPNPGLSTWLFGAAAAVVGDDPLGLVRVVQWCNVAALLGFVLLALRRVPQKQRQTWLWGLALWAVSPLPVLFSRKIWAQDLLPLFSLGVVAFHGLRQRPWGGALWGLLAAVLGQVHMSGFFHGAGLLAATALHDGRRATLRWGRWFVLGAALGALPLIPWLTSLDPGLLRGAVVGDRLQNMLSLSFFLYWLLDALGLNLAYTMWGEFLDFLRGPVVLGRQTHLLALAHGYLLLVGIWSVRRLASDAVAAARALRAGTLAAGQQPLDLLLWAMLLGPGLLLTLSGALIFPHYLIVTYPLIHLWLARTLRRDRGLLRGAALAQLFISACFLWTVHTGGGVPTGDYGRSYRSLLSSGG